MKLDLARKLIGACMLAGVIVGVMMTLYLRNDSKLLLSSQAWKHQRIKTELLREEQAQEKIRAAIAFIPWKTSAYKWGFMLIIGSVCSGLLIVAATKGAGYLMKASVVFAEVNDSKIPIRTKDLGKMTPAVMMLTQAQMIAAHSQEKCFEMVVEAHKMTRGLRPDTRPALQGAFPQLPITKHKTPSFRHVLDSLQAGDDMVLGYDYTSGHAISGTFDKIYSCGIFGKSGSGKTTGLYSIISQSLLTSPGITYYVIDPHNKRPEGLTAGLPKTDNFHHLDPHDCRSGLYEFGDLLNRRLDTITDYHDTPLVMLIDELPVLMDTPEGKSVEALLGRIAKEGRKVSVFCLIAGQDTRIKSAGGNRDLLCSTIGYNMLKKQAGYLFGDKDTVDLHKVVRDGKEAGLCVFSATDDEPLLVRQPFCQSADVEYVEKIVKQANGKDVVYAVENTGKQAEKSVIESVNAYLQTDGNTGGNLAERAGISGKDLSQYRGGKGMSIERKTRIETALIEFFSAPEKVENTGKQAVTTGKNVIPFGRK